MSAAFSKAGAMVVCVVAVGLVGVSGAQAIPVVYDESVDGDLQTSGLYPILPFDVGTNTVSGNSGAQTPVDSDGFAFSVPANTLLTSASVSLTDDIGDIIALGWNFRSGSANSGVGSFLESVNGPSPGLTVFTTPPLGPGLYNISPTLISAGVLPAYADYTFTFNVASAIPEPTTAMLGLMGAAGLMRRRRSAA